MTLPLVAILMQCNVYACSQGACSSCILEQVSICGEYVNSISTKPGVHASAKLWEFAQCIKLLNFEAKYKASKNETAKFTYEKDL